MERRRVLRVPASSANLGPGFDCLAAALGLYLDLEVHETGRFAVETDLEVARDRSNLVVRGFERLHPADDFTFRISSNIPLTGGLGSSAAAYVGGLMAADHIFELDADLFGLATELEGHPDNVAAVLHGGFVVSAPGGVVSFEPAVGLEGIVVAADGSVSTTEARAVLPAQVPLADAIYNVAHTAILVLGLARGDWDLVSRGLRDRLHEPYRAHLHPRSAELAERAAELGALGATISGAGPAVLFWTHYEQTASVFERLRAETQGWATVMRVSFESNGAWVRAM
jgi:homoserine kinase